MNKLDKEYGVDEE